jgi:hypothetical protein
MIVTTPYKYDETLTHTYSVAGMKIKQIETGIIYNEAIDITPPPYTYEETDIPREELE